MTTVAVTIPANIAQLIIERDSILVRGVYRDGDGDRLYQIQVILCCHFCEYARPAVARAGV